MAATQVIFYTIAAIMIVCAFMTVTSKKLLRAAVYLFFVLAATAAFYFMVDYLFLAAVQILVYAGGIIVLIIFSILLTSHINERLDEPGLLKKLTTGIFVIAGGLIGINLIVSYPFAPRSETSIPYDVGAIGEKLLSFTDNGYVLPFEVISVLLLAAMIAAIVIAKREKNDES
jgi:NADH-quinone oxidoreductase subunit J